MLVTKLFNGLLLLPARATFELAADAGRIIQPSASSGKGVIGHVEVRGLSEFRERLERGLSRPTHVISLLERREEFPELPAGTQHLKIRMDDIDRSWGGPSLPPTADHARRIIDFARSARQGCLVIHCKAGISRSAAAALGVLADRCGSANLAVVALREIRSIAYPNVLLAKHMGDCIGMDLERAAEQMRANWSAELSAEV